MSARRTRDELAAENEALYAELEDIYERIGDVLEDGDSDNDVPDNEGDDDD